MKSLWLALSGAVLLCLSIACPAGAGTISGGSEGSNVVDIVEVSPNNFTCMLYTPPMPTPESSSYSTPGDHYHDWFMFRIENAAAQAVTVTIMNADWTGGRLANIGANRKPFYSEEPDPYALSADSTWQVLDGASYIGSDELRLSLTPGTDLAWVVLDFPATPTHTANWIASLASNPDVTAEVVATTSRGLPLYMVFVTDPRFPLSGKKGVVVYGQEHAQEQTGGWSCQGLVEFLVSADPAAQSLRENAVFIVIPDLCPDCTAAGLSQDPDDGKKPQWRFNLAAIDRMMPGMVSPMTGEAIAIWERLLRFVNDDGRIDFCFNIHQGGVDNWWGCYELADPRSSSLDGFLRSYMPLSGAPWVPNARQGYSRGGWQNYPPAGVFSFRLLGRCWEEWRTVPMGYEVSLGALSDNFITKASGIKYFGEAIARAVFDHFGGFGRTINVLSPNGGEALASGGPATVMWTSTGGVGNVRIDYSTDGGGSWTSLVGSTANDGTEAVTLPAVDSASCLIRISEAAALGVSDSSDGLFTIGTPPAGTITVISPNGAETWDTHWFFPVKWTSAGGSGNVKIDLSIDGGLTWRPLTSFAVANNGTRNVNVPDTPSDRCLVRIRSVQNPAVSDVSDAFFTIRDAPPPATLTVISPNGGEVWPPGGTAAVTWTTTGVVDDVGISLSIDEGGSWTTLVASTPNDGSETVDVPATPSMRCLIWVYDARNDPWLNRPDADPLDISDRLFIIGSDGPPVPVGNTLRIAKAGVSDLRLAWAPDAVDLDWLGSNVYASLSAPDVAEAKTAAELEPFRVGPGSPPAVPDVAAPDVTFDYGGAEPFLFFTVRYIDQAGNLSTD
jgi:hypothetical protein